MAFQMELSVESVTIELVIRGRTFRLTAPRASLVLPANNPPASTAVTAADIKGHFHVEYHAPPETAFPLGTAEDVIMDISSILPAPSGSPVETLLTKWGKVTDDLKSIPIIKGAVDSALKTDVRITDLEIEVSRGKDPATNAVKTSGRFVLGLWFTPDEANRPRLFQLSIKSFGAKVAVQMALDDFKWM